CGIEIKSSMTYNSQFEKGLKKIDSGVKEKVEPKAIIYAGDFENNAGDIQLLNYAHLNWLL
ncbi:MAG: ATP-binding protein, partial [Muribaculaceae bacterium]